MKKQHLLHQTLYLTLLFLLFSGLSSISPGHAANQTVESPNPALFRLLSSHPVYFQIGQQGTNRLNPRTNYYTPALNPAHPTLKTAILQYEKNSPTPHTPKTNRLAQCKFTGAMVELDNTPDTAEWLVSTRGPCQPVSANRLKTAWLLQSQKNGHPEVLLSERASVFKIPEISHNGYRPLQISLSGKLNIANRTHEANCRKSWRFNGRSYTAQAENINIWGRPAGVSGAAYWHKIKHVYPDLQGQLPVECPRY